MIKTQKHSDRQSIGKLLVQQQFVSRWQVHQVLKIQQSNQEKKLGELLVEHGYAHPQHIHQILKQQHHKTSNSNINSGLGSLFVQQQLITQTQLNAALKIQNNTEDYLGNILVQQKYINSTELEEGLTQQIVQKHGMKDACKKKLGELLLDFKQISHQQLELAIKIQKGCQRKLGSLLVDLGFLPNSELKKTLNIQKRLMALGMTALTGLSLNACTAPIVPYQPITYPQITSQLAPAYSSDFSTPQYNYNSITYPIARKYQQGNFKTLQLSDTGKTIQVFKNGNKILNDVPFIKQGSDNTCGQAVMAMMLNYWNKPISYQAVVNEGNPLNLPTTNSQITSYTRKKGLKVQDYHDASLNNLYAQINKGRPTIVLLDFGGLSQAHYVVVVGYNQKKGTVIIHDSLGGPYTEMTTSTFNRMWQNRPVVSLPIFGGESYRRLMFDMTI